MNDTPQYIQQGWQCPICKRVYSPSTDMCYYCGKDNAITTNATSVGEKIDYIRRVMVGDTPETMKQIGTDGKVL